MKAKRIARVVKILVPYRTVKGHEITPGTALPVSPDFGGSYREGQSMTEIITPQGERICFAQREIWPCWLEDRTV